MSALRKTVLLRSLQMGTSMGMLWLTAAWMGPSLRGQTSMVVALAHIGVLFSGFGAGSGMVYHASRFSARALWQWSQVWAWSAAMMVGALSYAYMEWTPMQSIMMAILTWFHASVAAGRCWLLGNGRLHEDNIMGWMIPLLPTLVLGSLYIYQQFGGQVKPSLDMFLIIQGMALGLVAVWSWIEIYFKQIQSKQLIGEVGKALWSFNRWTASANLGQFVVYRLQYLYMFRVLGPAELGIYSVAVVVAEGAWVITQTYSTVLLSSLSAHQGPPDEHQVRRSWRWSFQAFLWTLLPVVVLFLIPIKWLSLVLGSSYIPVHGLWIALSPGILALACSNVLVQHFTALGRVKVSFFSSWGTALLILFGMAPAFHFAGAQGIAWWTSLVLVANTVGLLAFFRMTYKAYL